MTRLELRNLQEAEIRSYLVEEFGGRADGDYVRGDGWAVRLVRGEPARLGRMRIPVLFLEVSGPREAETSNFLRRKTMRGGG
ncbi:MAG: hypothetical protein ACE5EF_03120 [Dehalococcoidia bacterium]